MTTTVEHSIRSLDWYTVRYISPGLYEHTQRLESRLALIVFPAEDALELDYGLLLTLPDQPISYHESEKPVLENRCVVCHGCYDAPCQLPTALTGSSIA